MSLDAYLVRGVAGALCGALGPRLSVLVFHRVLPAKDPLFPEILCAAEFDQLLGFLKQSWKVIGLDEAVQQIKGNGLPARALAITFDDGYADNAEIAVPILVRHGLRATFFIATEFLDGGRMWNDTVIEALRAAKGGDLDLSSLGFGVLPLASDVERRQAIDFLLPRIKYLDLEKRAQIVDAVGTRIGMPLPSDLMMRGEQVKAIRDQGMDIGAHTATHPILKGLSPERAREEIVGSKHALEELLGETVGLFAYPNGKAGVDYEQIHADFAKEAGFVAAASTRAGVLTPEGDLFHIPRFTPWDRDNLRFGLRLCKNLLVS